jgi:hypothetical protein
VIEQQIRLVDLEPEASPSPVSLTLSAATGSGSLVPSQPRPTNHALAMTLGSEPPKPAPRRLGARAIGLALAAFAIIGVGVTQLVPRSSTLAAPSAAAAVPSRNDDLVIVELRVTPRDASLHLDGAPLDGNPYIARRPRGSEAHTLRVDLPDGTSETRTVTFDTDVHLELALARTDRAPAAVAQHAPAPRPASPTPPRAIAPAVNVAPTPAASPAGTPAGTPAAMAAPAASAASAAASKTTKPKPQLDKIDL